MRGLDRYPNGFHHFHHYFLFLVVFPFEEIRLRVQTIHEMTKRSVRLFDTTFDFFDKKLGFTLFLSVCLKSQEHLYDDENISYCLRTFITFPDS